MKLAGGRVRVDPRKYVTQRMVELWNSSFQMCGEGSSLKRGLERELDKFTENVHQWLLHYVLYPGSEAACNSRPNE